MAAWETAEDFATYLAEKKIDGPAWQVADPKAYATAEEQFNALGPKNFDQQQKFLIMAWRRAHPVLTPRPEGMGYAEPPAS